MAGDSQLSSLFKLLVHTQNEKPFLYAVNIVESCARQDTNYTLQILPVESIHPNKKMRLPNHSTT